MTNDRQSFPELYCPHVSGHLPTVVAEQAVPDTSTAIIRVVLNLDATLHVIYIFLLGHRLMGIVHGAFITDRMCPCRPLVPQPHCPTILEM